MRHLVLTEFRRAGWRRLTRWSAVVALVLVALSAASVFLTHEAVSSSELERRALTEASFLGLCTLEEVPGEPGGGSVPDGFDGPVVGYQPSIRCEDWARTEELANWVALWDPGFHRDDVWSPAWNRSAMFGGSAESNEPRGPDRGALLAAGFGWLLVAFIVGGSLVGSEYRHGSIENELLWETRRFRVGAVKLLVGSVVGALFAGVGTVLMVGSLWPSLALRGSARPVSDGWATDALLAGLRVAAVAGALALMAGGLAFLTRNAAAVLGVVVGLGAAELIVTGFWRDAGPFMFFRNLISVVTLSEVPRIPDESEWVRELGSPDFISHGPRTAVLVIAVYVAVSVGAGLLRFVRSDVG